MPFLEINGLSYYYTRQGAGPPMLLLHGFGGSERSWAGVSAAFAQRVTVLAVDLPGHGRTDAPPEPQRYAMPAVAADLGRLLDEAADGPAHLLGYSMGGRLALYLALDQPARVRSLVLESASPGLPTEAERAARREQDEQLATRIMREGVPAFTAFWEGLPLFATQRGLPEAVQAEQRRQRLLNRQEGLAGSLRGMGTGAQPDLWPRLPSLSVPTLLIAGALDEKYAALAARMQAGAGAAQAGLLIVPECGHNVHLEAPVQFAVAVAGWLAGR